MRKLPGLYPRESLAIARKQVPGYGYDLLSCTKIRGSIDCRLTDKAELAVQEVQIRSLLKLIDKDSGGDGDGKDDCNGEDADATEACDHNAACYDLADFYDRTDRIPENTGSYSEDLVKRYIQSITVKSRYLVVKFKAGVEIKVKA